MMNQFYVSTSDNELKLAVYNCPAGRNLGVES